jgi:Zn-dependent protease
MDTVNEIFPNLHWTNLLIIPGMLVAFTVHELGHAITAYFLGDSSQVEQGNITLNPLKHLSIFGSIAFILTGYFGWAKALQVSPHKLRRRYLDLFFVALSGPLASLTLSLIGLVIILTTATILIIISGATTDRVLVMFFPVTTQLPQTLDIQAISLAFTGYLFISSLCLALTSLLPLPGFDGFVAIASLVVFFRERKSAQNPAPPSPNNQATLAISQQKRRNNVAEIHFKVGMEYHDAKQYDDAIARYRQAISSDQNFGPAYINLGLAYLGKGKRREAIQAFRGTIQFADDQKSQSEAWQQLHLLSEVSPTDEEQAKASMAEMGVEPWTDTQLRPNWINFFIGITLIVVLGGGLYGYVIAQLIGVLQG